MGRRPLVRRRWRRGYGVSRPCTARDASQATATTSHATTVPASMRDAFSVPSCPANVPEVSRGLRLPCLMAMSPATGRMAHRVRSAPAARRRAAWRIRAHAGASPAATPQYSRIAQTALWHLGVAIHELWRRTRAGFPPAVWSPSLSGWLPTTLPQDSSHMAATIAPAPKRHQRKIVSTLAATAQKADLAPRHYRIAPPGDRPRKASSAASGRRPVVTGRCAPCTSDRVPDGHRHGAHHRLVGAGRLHVGPVGVRRPRDAPAALDGHQPHAPASRYRDRPPAPPRCGRRPPARRDRRTRSRLRPARRAAMRGRDADEPLRTFFVPMTSTRLPPTGLRHGNRWR